MARIYQALRTPFDCHGHQLTSDASIGIAIAPRHGSDLFDLLKNADLAMYAAKAAGRRTYRFFDPSMEQQANLRRELEADLRTALAQGGFELHYQPLVDLRSDEVTGCEALLRWRHPVRGMVSPADFVPVAEETGLIEEIGQWVLRTACAEAATWPAHVRIAVNVSPIQFKSETLPLKVAAALAETGLDPRRLELEITEAVLIADDDAALVALNQLRALGIHIALDDFGTGYSSLQYLQRFPFDKIKIDRCFVKEVTHNSSSASIIRAVVSIAADRNMITTAEGVETLQQRETVQNLGMHADAGLSVQRGAAGERNPRPAGIGRGRRRGGGVTPAPVSSLRTRLGNRFPENPRQQLHRIGLLDQLETAGGRSPPARCCSRWSAPRAGRGSARE